MTEVSNHSMKRITAILIVLIISFYPGVLSLDAAASESALRAGTARIDITPEKPVKMSGYGARTALSEGVHDPLSARVVAFENDGERLVLVSSDLLGYYGGTAEQFRKVILSEFDLKPGELS